MSRIGRLPIEIPAGVEVTIAENNVVTVKGPKGTLTESLPVEMDIKMEDNQVVVTRPNDLKKMKSLHGLTRTLIANMVTGVTKGYEKVLEINGVGYRAQKQGKKLILSLGYSHPVEMDKVFQEAGRHAGSSPSSRRIIGKVRADRPLDHFVIDRSHRQLPEMFSGHFRRLFPGAKRLPVISEEVPRGFASLC